MPVAKEYTLFPYDGLHIHVKLLGGISLSSIEHLVGFYSFVCMHMAVVMVASVHYLEPIQAETVEA